MSVRVTFLGTGSAFCDGGRSHACIHVSAPGVSLLLDCGGSSLPRIKQHIDADAVDGVAVSHLHGDHFGGIPYLILQQHWQGRRTRPFTVGGPPGLAARLRHAESSLYPEFFGASGKPGFPVREIVLGSAEREVGGALVSAFPVTHVPEAEPHGLRVRVGDKVIAYSGDASWTDALPRLAKGADLFICECTYYDVPDPVHISYRTLEQHRAEIDCGRIVLVHVSRDLVQHRDAVDLEIPDDGTVIEL